MSKLETVKDIVHSYQKLGTSLTDKTKTQESKNKLSHIFKGLLTEKQNFIQARLIGVENNGKELVRGSVER